MPAPIAGNNSLGFSFLRYVYSALMFDACF